MSEPTSRRGRAGARGPGACWPSSTRWTPSSPRPRQVRDAGLRRVRRLHPVPGPRPRRGDGDQADAGCRWLVAGGGATGAAAGAAAAVVDQRASTTRYLISGKPFFGLPAAHPDHLRADDPAGAPSARSSACSSPTGCPSSTTRCFPRSGFAPGHHRPLLHRDRGARPGVRRRSGRGSSWRRWAPGTWKRWRTDVAPRWLVYALVLLAALSVVPFALIAALARHDLARSRASSSSPTWTSSRSSRRRPANPLFADGRAMRPPVPGTVARGELEENGAFVERA